MREVYKDKRSGHGKAGSSKPMGKYRVFQERTLEKVYNRLIRYRKRLIVEGINWIQSQELELKVRRDRKLRVIDDSPTVWVGEKETDMSEVIELSKNRVPSLYRRYKKELERMKDMLE